MTGREWQPGDVAWLDLKAGPTLGMRSLDGGWMIRDQVSISGYTAPAVTTVYLPAGSVRPAAVIDPDSDDVDRVAELMAEHGPYMGVFRRGVLQAALREFASPSPPKPDEPTGLGAVVEDTRGELWIRRPKPPEWISATGNAFPVTWDSIDVAKVLDGGYKAGEPS